MGWLELIPGELVRLPQGAAPQHPKLHLPGLVSSHHTAPILRESCGLAQPVPQLQSCTAVCREAAGCCSPSHTRWQPVPPAGLFTLVPLAATKAENISHNSLFAVPYRRVMVYFYSFWKSTFLFVPCSCRGRGIHALPACGVRPRCDSRNTAEQRIWRHALC